MTKSSSTALAEAMTRHGNVFDDAATSPGVVPDVYQVLLSAETLMKRVGGRPHFLSPGRLSLLDVEGSIYEQLMQSGFRRAVALPTRQSLTGFCKVAVSAATAENIVLLWSSVMPIAHLPSVLSSTDLELGSSRTISKEFAEAAGRAADEWFESGTESKFAKTLSSLLLSYSNGAIAAVESFVGSPGVNVEVAVEAAKWLGEVDHPPTALYRRTLLEKMLTSSSIRLRHGAAAGLASMDDPASLNAVRCARDDEASPRLREYLQLVVDQLERTAACRNL